MGEIRKIDEFDYFDLLKRLVDDGGAFAKTTPRHAIKWPALVIHTETSGGQMETAKEIDPDVYILFDPAGFPTVADRENAAATIINNFRDKAIAQQDLRAVDYRGPDLWVMEGKKFRAEYEPDPVEKNKYQPNEEARTAPRQCLTVDEDIEFPVQWGTFIVEKDGAIATRVSDLPAIQAALTDVAQNIRSLQAQNLPADELKETSRALIRQTLYKDDGTTVFDIYGMKPSFLEKNYDVFTAEAPQRKTGTDTPKPPKNNS